MNEWDMACSGSMPITPPIFVCGDDLYIFVSVTMAETCLEPVDIEPDEHGYDAQGRLLRVLVRGEVKHSWFGIDQHRARVELVLAEEEPKHGEELRAVLVKWLGRAEGTSTGLSTASLEDLVDRARKYAVGAGTRGSLLRRVRVVVVTLGLAVLLWIAYNLFVERRL